LREDYPKRVYKNLLVHTLEYLTVDAESAEADDHIKLDWKPVVVTNYQPTERKY
jgi:succinate dehydrogenase / fumarate reductase flavoprotein subunit